MTNANQTNIHQIEKEIFLILKSKSKDMNEVMSILGHLLYCTVLTMDKDPDIVFAALLKAYKKFYDKKQPMRF